MPGQLPINRTGTGPNPRPTLTSQDRFDNGFSMNSVGSGLPTWSD